MGTITASEINLYKTCARAWAFKKNGAVPSNSARLATGSAYHHELGQRSRNIQHIRSVCFILLGIAVLLMLGLFLTGNSK